MFNKKTLLSSLGCSALIAVSAQAATITQVGGNDSSEDWNTPGDWSDGLAPSASNDYVTAGADTSLRGGPSSSGAASTFGGGSLTVVDGTRLLLKNFDTTSTINGAFTLSGGTIHFGPNFNASFVNPTSTFDVASFTNSGVSDVQIGRRGGDLNILSALTGSGHLHISADDDQGDSGVDSVIFAGISGFTGKVTIGQKSAGAAASFDDGAVILDLGTSDFTFSDTVTIINSSVLKVNTGQTLTFAEGDLIDENGAVAAGTYTTAALGANYDGGGTIVVIPEPGSLALLGLGGLCLIKRRRRDL